MTTRNRQLHHQDVILVNEQDQETGRAEKLYAHENNLLHRAFSVFIFNQEAEPQLLLQQRALDKYHSPGLWTNTCCSHPRPNEDIIEAGERRLQEELGIKSTLKNLGWFHYNAHFANGLAENEIDHVLIGTLAKGALIQPNRQEVHAIRWVSVTTLEQELAATPRCFTPWLALALSKITK
ncbi:MAG: isopentenyl-diphosphate delta-isomerase [Gammaproteobacteria bacterium RIFCSPHIGHO2_12_FULL_45_12]|nr:MAG: isopentenyl-diphosphate delta-isomerase [Gammaproteobacteria bacterium RIFCSPHIGHO2_12_FULL_45_12]